MKTLQTLLNGFRKALPAALMLCAGIAANAQVRIPFTQRTSAFSPTQTIYSINGDFTMIGNTNMTLQSYGATINNSNNTMVKVDNDGISSTNNSSSSTLTFSNENGANPNCSRILFAGLYWTGRTDATPTELQKRTVKFRGPGQADYTTYTATPSNIRYPGDDNMYAAFVEVTSQVQQRGLGEYWAADMALTTGNGGSTGYYGGWGLVVVYENSKMKKRDVTLFDGYAYVVGGTAQWELPVSGFTSALSGAVNTKLGMMAGEGDVTITGDKFEIQKLTSTNWELLSHGGNSATNFFNGSIFTGGNSRNPNLVNNTGMDISMFNIPNASNSVIGNGQTSTKFRYSSTQDTYIIYSICMAVDAYEPVVEGFLSTVSVNNIPTTTSNITVLPGDEIKYKVQIRNKGNEAVNNARIEIPLPYAAITYQGSSVNVFSPASSSATPYVDASLGANGTLVWDFGTLPLPSDPNTVLGEIIFTLKASEDCELYRNFNCSAPSVQIDGTISGIGANTQISVDDQPFYVGFSNVDGCSTEPLLGPFNIDINSANWVTANCPVSDGVRDFTYCNRTAAIPVTDVLGFYPAGTSFFNANQTMEYTVANPFPNTPGPITYRALLPGTSCVLSFTISITNISSVPTVAAGTIEYCKNDVAVALTATSSNPSYQLFYYAPSSTIAQPLLIPSTAAVGNFNYQVAEGPSSTCISATRANIPVQVNALPTITATPTQIVCFGGTGSVELAANGGTGALTFNASNPSTSNLTAGSYTYEIGDSKGCNASATAVINAAPAQPSQPSLACYQTANWDVASCSWIVSGTMPAQPAIACYETATFNTTSCAWDVTGTQAPAPTNLSCWETATFNTTSCAWDVTGTQAPAPPNLSCWETATFNTTSCAWDVTGTQAPAPTNLSCWETATFNTTSCAWDVTGTQTPAPTNLSCWETATFNTTSCAWDVTGTQAPAPTNLSCWETATFNTTSCAWDVTGTQAPAPTNLSCWETATFNTTSCAWDVTGTQTPAPTNLSCWETATFNTTSCSWDVTGTQPEAPATACYENASFNASTCSWDVTGTQPEAPATACYENASFNASTCSWDVTGTQPAAPATACYENASFNASTCSWDVTGTQPAAPTTACYENASFNASTCSWDVIGTQPAAPTTACYENASFNASTCSWDVTGTQPAAPTTACYENASFNASTCTWDVTGTQPAAPATACYENASFNASTCSWDVTGTQPAAPATACYENASFNASTCSWDVTGTQPEAPATACYENASFNASTCSWDITGTQPAAPATACYENASFNASTCSWDITGTQPAQPTNLSCWQTATFNTTSCAWDVTGTQAPAPTNLSCWQTATFNTTSCAWDVTGTQAPAPTNLSCWQTATFNTTSCGWDVTGTQAPAPTNLSCWQTATFNTTNCNWDVTGTQAPAPTGLECYQTATFNNASCSWVVSGTPPTPVITNASACGSYTWSVNGQTYTQSGTYNFSAGCVNSTLQLTITAATTAGQISGPSNSCAHQGTSGTNATYSVQATNATGFVWTLPSGATNISGQGTASISFRFSSTFSSGNVSVVVSGCGTPITRSISVTRTAPATPGAITGTVNVCAFRGTNTPVTYSIAAVANAASYTWTLPSGVTLVSGSGTTTIQVLIGSSFCGGNITVRANSACGNSSTSCLALSVSTPSTPVSISGLTTACPGNVQTYSTAAVNNATSYNWTLPTGASITSGAGTNTISVSFASAFCGGTLSVRAVNGCGQSSARSITINRNVPATPAAINGPTTNLCGTGTYTYSIAPVSGATSYTWTVPTGASIVSNNGTSITVNFTNSFSSGSITVKAVNACGSGTARSITLSRLPSTPASIAGPSTVCRNQQGVVYSTPVISGLTYTWTVPSGAVITAGQGTASVTVKFGTSNGNVTVKANNGCGSSSTRSLAVCVASCRFGEPEPEEVITEAVSAFEFVVYPNPGIGRVNISMPELAEEIQLRVFAANGTLVRYEQIPAGTRNWTMQLEAEADGVYMIQLETATQIKQLRYVKQ